MPYGWTARLLILQGPDGTVTPYWPLFDYFAADPWKSDAWQAQCARALGLFYDYCQVKLPLLTDSNPRAKHRELLRGFGYALLNGTIVDLRDPLRLYWLPQPLATARRLTSAIERFARWYSNETATPSDIALQQATPQPSDFFHLYLNGRHEGYSLLEYLRTPGQDRQRGTVNLPFPVRSRNRADDYVVSFPPDRVEEVLWTGFLRRGKHGESLQDYKLRDMMIFLLLGYGGLRIHEVFHLWLTDVVEDPCRPGYASVFLYQPEWGLAYIDDAGGRRRRVDRRRKLQEVYGLPPRNRGTGSYRVGWKNSKTITRDYYAAIHWVDPVASALFLELYNVYVWSRESIMRQRRALGYYDHPFLFVSEQESRSTADGAKQLGAPASKAGFAASLARAVERVGLEYAKELGTTPHGLRHLYAYTLRKLGVSRKVMQEGLRHCHPYSQDVYGNPTPKDISDALNECLAQSRDTLPASIRLEQSLTWMEQNRPEFAVYGKAVL